MDKDPRFWHSRGYLPHFDKEGFTQFITFRLADSMPQDVLEKWRLELERNEITDADFRRRIEHYLDQNYGTSYLRDHAIASILQETLLKWDGERYRLISWVIMPIRTHSPHTRTGLHRGKHNAFDQILHRPRRKPNTQP